MDRPLKFKIFENHRNRDIPAVVRPVFKIGQTVAEIWRFNSFQNGGRPPSLNLENEFF